MSPPVHATTAPQRSRRTMRAIPRARHQIVLARLLRSDPPPDAPGPRRDERLGSRNVSRERLLVDGVVEGGDSIVRMST